MRNPYARGQESAPLSPRAVRGDRTGLDLHKIKAIGIINSRRVRAMLRCACTAALHGLGGCALVAASIVR